MAKLLRKYTKKSRYAFCAGVYQTLELIAHRPQAIQSIYLRADADKNDGVRKIKDFCSNNRIAYHVNNKAIIHATGKDNIQALAIFEKYENPLKENTNHVVLVNPAGAGNVGTILRTMSAFSIGDLGIIKPGVDIFHPEVVRASMGSLFTLRFQYFLNIDEYVSAFKNDLYVVAPAMPSPLDKVSFKKPYTLIFIEEGQPIPVELSSKGEGTSIPVDDVSASLNIAQSVGIALYQARNSR